MGYQIKKIGFWKLNTGTVHWVVQGVTLSEKFPKLYKTTLLSVESVLSALG